MVENGIKLVKEEILNVFGIQERMFYSNLKEGLKKYPEDQLRKIKKGLYYINPDLIPTLFKRKRLPNNPSGSRKNQKVLKDYILTPDVSFNFIGCIRPPSMTEKECEETIKFLFKKITNNVYPKDMKLFYFIEKNNIQKKDISSSQYHIHYLIQTTDVENGFIQRFKDTIKEYLGGNPFLQHYKSKWEVEGKKYSVKDVCDNSLCGYLTYKRRKK